MEILPFLTHLSTQDTLQPLLKNAFKHVLTVISRSKPSFKRIDNLKDEVFATISFMVESYHINKYEASFSEKFYSLKRVPLSDENKHLSLSNKIRSIISVVFAPYIKDKLDAYYEQLSKSTFPKEKKKTLKRTIVLLFKQLYPWLRAAYQALVLVFQISYMFGYSRDYSPLSRLAGVNLKSHQYTDSKLSYGKGLFSLTGLLYIGVTALQFHDWFNQSEGSLQDNISGNNPLSSIPPPSNSMLNVNKQEASTCPLCNKKRTNDTVISITGYIFCYSCIHKYVTENHKCPLSDFPVELEHLIKLNNN